MKRYFYRARNADGAHVSGAIECVDEGTALAALAGRGLFLTAFAAMNDVRGVVAGLTLARPNRRATIAFFRSFATLVSAGVPLRKALDAGISQSACPALREALCAVAHDVENGLPLSSAIERRPREFGDSAALLVRAGESGGRLEDALARLAALLERRQAVARRLATALAYPAFVTIAACALVVFLITGVLPMFDGLYAQLHVPLPAGTAFLMRVSALLRAPASLLVIVTGCSSAAACFYAFLRSADRTRLFYRIPVVGTIGCKAVLARVAHTIGVLLQSGIALSAALEAAAQAAGGTPFQRSLSHVQRAVSAGSALAEALQNDNLYDPLFVQLVRAGEDAGSLDAMFLKAAEYYHADVESSVDAAAALVEPALVLVLGAVIAALVASIMLPLYSMIGNIR